MQDVNLIHVLLPPFDNKERWAGHSTQPTQPIPYGWAGPAHILNQKKKKLLDLRLVQLAELSLVLGHN